MMRRRLTLPASGRRAAVCTLAALSLACGDSPTGDEPVEAVALRDPPSAPLALGDTVRLAAEVTGAGGDPIASAHVSWETSDAAVVTVDTEGLLRAVGRGSAVVTASSGGQTATTPVSVDFRQVSGAVSFASVDAGAGHACALTHEGLAYCWGSNGSGELGDGTTTPSETAVPVAGGHLFKQVSAGDRHSCGIATDGSAWCWGLNTFAELGLGVTSAYSAEPVEVVGGHRFKLIAASDHLYTCAITTDDEPYCWGHNDQNQLGRDPQARIDSLVAPVAGGVAMQAVSGGDFHTCGVAADGTAYCWGYNRAGSIGNGEAAESRHATPVSVSGGHRFLSIAVGTSHSCGVAITREAYCWGANEGKLGTGTSDDDAHASPERVMGDARWESLAAGFDHSCGLTIDGDAYCWGGNAEGQLGNLLSASSAQPVRVAPDLRFRSLSAGRYQVCGVTTAGEVRCWGA